MFKIFPSIYILKINNLIVEKEDLSFDFSQTDLNKAVSQDFESS